MNCLDFRRAILARPFSLEEGARAHSDECPSCREYLERQRELDSRLVEALRVPVPEGLAERVLVAQGLRGDRRRVAWAVAASVILAFGGSVLLWPFISGYRLGYEAIAHVIHEPQSFRIASRQAPDYLGSQLAAQGIRLVASLGAVTYAVLCPMDDQNARHLVVATADGPVTLLLLPDDSARRGRTVTQANGFTAITLQAGRGSIAIVAADRGVALATERMLVPV